MILICKTPSCKHHLLIITCQTSSFNRHLLISWLSTDHLFIICWSSVDYLYMGYHRKVYGEKGIHLQTLGLWLFHPSKRFLLSVHKLTQTQWETDIVNHVRTRLHSDSTVNNATDSTLEREIEWTTKRSTRVQYIIYIINLNNATYHLLTIIS